MRIIWSTKLFALLLMLSCAAHSSFAQRYQTGLLGSFNFNTPLNDDYGLNIKWENRLVGPRGVIGGVSERDLFYDLSDLSAIVSRKVGLSSKLAFGYLWRSRGGDHRHRLMQQYLLVQRYQGFRLGWRFASDQTFGAGEEFVFRLRVRATGEIPLNGQTADPGEWYLKLRNEYLGAWSYSDFEPELRVVSLFGYEFTDKNKLEMGLDYRFRSFDTRNPSSQIWANVNWYVKM